MGDGDGGRPGFIRHWRALEGADAWTDVPKRVLGGHDGKARVGA